MARKYLKGGALNPAWCDEQDAEMIAEEVSNCITELLNSIMDVELDVEIAEGVNVHIASSKNVEPICMCNIVDAESDYEAKFNFVKNHSSTPEDLELALKIIGLG